MPTFLNLGIGTHCLSWGMVYPFNSRGITARQDLGKTKRPEGPSLLQSEGISNRIPRKGHQLVSIVYLLLTADLMHPLRGG